MTATSHLIVRFWLGVLSSDFQADILQPCPLEPPYDLTMVICSAFIVVVRPPYVSQPVGRAWVPDKLVHVRSARLVALLSLHRRLTVCLALGIVRAVISI